MLETAFEMLMTRDLPLGLDNIKMEEVIEVSGVPRGSGYRVWSSEEGPGGPQGRFRNAVAQMVLAGEAMVHANEDDAAEFADLFDATEAQSFKKLKPEERGELMRELVRVVVARNYRAVAADPLLRVQHGLTAIVRMRANPAGDERLAAAVETAGRLKTDRFMPLYERILDTFGLRLKSGYTAEQFAYATLALSEGTWLRPSIVDKLDSVDEQGNEWTLMAVAFMGLLREFVENDPDNGPVTVF